MRIPVHLLSLYMPRTHQAGALSMIEILVVCPANCTTGGPECLHEFASELNKIDGVHARIWYWDIKEYPPMPEEYKVYGCEYVSEIPEDFDGVLIVPEIWANRVLDYPGLVRCIYWLGLDAYASWTPSDKGAFFADDSIIHIAQSEYAYDFLKKFGVGHLVKCTDTVNADFYEQYKEPERNNVVLYNPAKSTPFMRELIAACDGIVFKPIQNMTRSEVIDVMRHAKLYLDFGEFPGRERIPREAVLCGCCIITSKIGSADYEKDFRHNYKFDSKPSHIWAIVNRIHYVLDNYEECRKDFSLFRETLKVERFSVKQQIRKVVDEIQHYYTGA